MDRLRLRSEGGFTIIELLIVIAIIGVLAVIAIPQFGTYRRRGFDADVKSNVKNLTIAQEAYFADNSIYAQGAGNTPQFTTRGFKQSVDVDITAAGSATDFTITGTALAGCSTGSGIWTFNSSTGLITGTLCY